MRALEIGISRAGVHRPECLDDEPLLDEARVAEFSAGRHGYWALEGPPRGSGRCPIGALAPFGLIGLALGLRRRFFPTQAFAQDGAGLLAPSLVQDITRSPAGL